MNDDLRNSVGLALAEDIGSGDLTAALIAESAATHATVITREDMVLAGRAWFDEVMHQVDNAIRVDWLRADGDNVPAGSTICHIDGAARSLLTAERTALNFLQLLSATATETNRYVTAVAETDCKILDTRKTIPGLRLAQKYAVRCGGGANHRVGLFDAILIKENHIASAGGITAAIASARALHPGMPVEIEVETEQQVREAVNATAERLLLDNFSTDMLLSAVNLNRRMGNPPAELEASGNITLDGIREIAATGVDFISIGALTKNIRAIDLSMRFSDPPQ
ncbi:MAG: carboxylating nicotinate-nucleotide diphosphorylase [Woeseiaceae bacterium]